MTIVSKTLPITYYLLPITYYLLHTYYLLPITYYLLVKKIFAKNVEDINQNIFTKPNI